MRVRFSMFSRKRKQDIEPLQNAIEYVADRCGHSSHEIARIVSWFLEGLADEVTHGRVVRIPGFGMFAPVPKKTSRDAHPRCRVVFSPALAFTRQVLYGAPPNLSGARALRNHRKCHGYIDNPPAGRTAERVFTAMEKMRADIDAQLDENV